MEAVRFKRLLHNIADQLRKVDLDHMKYLCSEKVAAGERDQAKTAREFFTLLQKRELIGPSDTSFLVELLNGCDRKDLVNEVEGVREDIVTESGAPIRVTSFTENKKFKVLLNQLSDEMVAKDIESFKFLIDIPGGTSANVTSGLQIFDYLQKNGEIGASDVSLLIDIFSEIHRKDLARKVEAFVKNQENATKKTPERSIKTQPEGQREASTHSERIFPTHNRPALLTPSDFQPRPPAFPLPSTAPVPPQNLPFIDEEDDMPLYRMDSRPRGIALIFSNRKFAGNGDHLIERFGTEKDVDNLKLTWEKLHFNVVVKENLKASEIYATARDYSRFDHSVYDCFVCCILSHGVQGSIYGSDGELVEIGDILSLFKGTACPSLANKPKLFFIQACRGREFDEGAKAEAQADAVRSSDEDAMRANFEPNEGHFLLGYATPPGYVSWRSTEHGSWYISHLCDVFTTYCERFDLMTMMTKVNDKVSDAFTKKGYKQCPQPVYSLRKRIYFNNN